MNHDLYYGEHIFIKKGIYTHHGLGIEQGKVIHYAGFLDTWDRGPVEIIEIKTFSFGQEIMIRHYPNRIFNKEEAVKRAKSRLGENNYSIWGNNCEHFVEWSINGLHESRQVYSALRGILISFSIAAVSFTVASMMLSKKNND